MAIGAIGVSSDYSASECAVCAETLKDSVSNSDCGHIFCKKCLQSVQSCPQCRTPIKAIVRHHDVDSIVEENERLRKALLARVAEAPAPAAAGVQVKRPAEEQLAPLPSVMLKPAATPKQRAFWELKGHLGKDCLVREDWDKIKEFLNVPRAENNPQKIFEHLERNGTFTENNVLPLKEVLASIPGVLTEKELRLFEKCEREAASSAPEPAATAELLVPIEVLLPHLAEAAGDAPLSYVQLTQLLKARLTKSDWKRLTSAYGIGTIGGPEDAFGQLRMKGEFNSDNVLKQKKFLQSINASLCEADYRRFDRHHQRFIDPSYMRGLGA